MLLPSYIQDKFRRTILSKDGLYIFFRNERERILLWETIDNLQLPDREVDGKISLDVRLQEQVLSIIIGCKWLGMG